MTIHRAPTGARYAIALSKAWNDRKGPVRLGEVLTDYRQANDDLGRFYIDIVHDQVTGGFIVKPDGELVGLFSRLVGRGDDLVNAALNSGAQHLDCFDGFLVGFYARHGFVEYDRQPNWTPGGPAVVYMGLPSWLEERAGLANLAESIARCTGARESTVIHEHVEYGVMGERKVVTDSVETFKVVGSAEYDAETNELSALIDGNPWKI